jgi:hypothetical protein
MKYHHLGIPTNVPREGMKVAFIVKNGAPVELLQFDNVLKDKE